MIRRIMVWFSLAAERHYDNAAEIVETLMASIPVQQQARMQSYILAFQKRFGQSSVNAKYFPELNKQNLSARISFAGETELSGEYTSLDDDMGVFSSDISSQESAIDASFGDDGDDEFGEDSFDPFAAASGSTDDELFNKPYFLVVDYDIAPDGSRRDFVTVQSIGSRKKNLYDLATTSLPQPQFNGENVHFVNRSSLGIANYDKYRIRESHGHIYTRIRRLERKLQESDKPHDKYQYATLLMNFTWLAREADQVDNLLKSAAEAGHGQAQFEYGLKLYREQKDPEQALYWIAQASKEGITQAEYRLGRIFLDSPWVIADEEKALYWLAAAAEKEHTAAIRKVAELKLLAKNKSLHDIEGAIKHLEQIAETQDENPQYHYLQEMAHIKMQPRQLSRSVFYIREAIDLGEDYHWDVTPWQQLLAKWTSGGIVTVQDL